MKKNRIVPVLLVIATILGIAAICFFVLPKQNAGEQTPVNVPNTETTASKPAEIDSSYLSLTAQEGTEIITDAEAEPDIIDITGENSKNIRIETTGPVEEETPSAILNGYQEIFVRGISRRIWAFQDASGDIKLRVYGSRWKKVNNVNQDKETGFYDVSLSQAD